MNRVEREWAKLLAAGFIVNGTEPAAQRVKRITQRGPLMSMVNGLNAEFFRKEFEAGHVLQLKFQRPGVIEKALIYKLST